MAIEIKAPTFPESVADGTVATWHKQPGDAVKRDDLIVDIETDKVVLEVLATADGVLGAIVKNEGDTVLSDEVLGSIVEGGAAAAAPAAAAPAAAQAAAPAAEGEDDPAPQRRPRVPVTTTDRHVPGRGCVPGVGAGARPASRPPARAARPGPRQGRGPEGVGVAHVRGRHDRGRVHGDR